MSADNGVYILETRDGFRVSHLQSIENMYWWYDCCDNPKVEEQDIDGNDEYLSIEDLYYHEQCQNCGTEYQKWTYALLKAREEYHGVNK